MASDDSFGAKGTLEVGEQSYEIYRLDAVEGDGSTSTLPYSLKVLLENLLRTEDGANITADAHPGARPAGTPTPSPTRRSSSRRPA